MVDLLEVHEQIETEAQAISFMEELVRGVKDSRISCNIAFPGDQSKTVGHQRKAYYVYLVKHGAALGALTTLHRCGKLGIVAYNTFREQVMGTLIATVVGPNG